MLGTEERVTKRARITQTALMKNMTAHDKNTTHK